MKLEVSFFLTAVLLCNNASCQSNTKTEAARITWKLTDAKIGKQMPPHHEPDAVLINTGGNRQPRIPEGIPPQFPGGFGVFGFPRPGEGPGINRPGFFPGAPGTPRLPAYPNPFGIPGGHIFPGNPSTQGAPGIPNVPGVFISSGQGSPLMPNTPNIYDVQMGGPGFTVGTGYFIPNGESPHTGEPRVFGHPEIFAVAGSGNVPFPIAPDFFIPARGSNIPRIPDNLPPVKGIPETSNRRRNDFQPERKLPGSFYPEAPLIPNEPELNSNGNFPRHEIYGGAGGREINNDPIAHPFPLVEASSPYYITF